MGPQNMAYNHFVSFHFGFFSFFNIMRTRYAQSKRNRGVWQWQKQYDKNYGTNNGIFIACVFAALTVDGFKWLCGNHKNNYFRCKPCCVYAALCMRSVQFTCLLTCLSEKKLSASDCPSSGLAEIRAIFGVGNDWKGCLKNNFIAILCQFNGTMSHTHT